MNKFRILHIINYFYSSLGYQETFLAKFHSSNHEVAVITSDRYPGTMYEVNRNLLERKVVGSGLFIEEGVKVLRLPTLFVMFENPWLIGLERAILDFNPDIIIMHGVMNFSSIRIAKLKKKLQRTNLLIDDHMIYEASRGGWTKLFYRLFRTFFIPMLIPVTDRFIAVTYETKDFMQRVYGIPAEKIIVIPLGVDTSRFRHDPSARRRIREEYGIKDDCIIFIYAGKVIPSKGVHLFVNAGLRLSRKFDNVVFFIVGGKDPEYFEYIQRIVVKDDMSNRFIFIDAVPNSQLCMYYSAADVGVWPLQCSITMLEANACGLPIVVSNKSNALERIGKGNGISYKEGDVNDLERKMSLLLDQELRNKMRGKAFEYARSIDWTIIADRFLELVDRS